MRLLLTVLLPSATLANIYAYLDTPLAPDHIQYLRVGMWAPSDSKQDSSVSVDLSFRREAARRSGLVQVLIFNAAALPLESRAGLCLVLRLDPTLTWQAVDGRAFHLVW